MSRVNPNPFLPAITYPNIFACTGTCIAHFGEISLITEELRSATVKICSDHAKVLRMTKEKFDEIMSAANKIGHEIRAKIGRDVVDKVPLFKSLTSVNRRQLLGQMKPMQFLDASYICRQGKIGNTFYIITEGICRVTLNNDDGPEKELAKLYVGDFFGEVALIEASCKRTANVISEGHVSCMTLARNEFHTLMKGLQNVLLEHQAVRGAAQKKKVVQHQRRRISAFDPTGRKHDGRALNLFKRLGKFMSESLWNSLYSRMYRMMILEPEKYVDEAGPHAKLLMLRHPLTADAVDAIAEKTKMILETAVTARSKEDNAFTIGLMRVKSLFRLKLCAGWTEPQVAELVKKFKFAAFKPMRKVIECDTKGTCAFLILRGAVRIFSTVVNEITGRRSLEFEEDLGPGEVFGEAALGGVYHRYITAQAMTDVELAIIEDDDFTASQDKTGSKMSVDDKFKFLTRVSLFRSWEPYRLYRVANALQQDEVDRGTVLFRRGDVHKDLYFLLSGRLDVVTSLTEPHTITHIEPGEYFGESGFLTRMQKIGAGGKSPPIIECSTVVAVTRVDLLVLTESQFSILANSHCLELMRTAYPLKKAWRNSRATQLREERVRVRHIKSSLLKINDMTPEMQEVHDAIAAGRPIPDRSSSPERTSSGSPSQSRSASPTTFGATGTRTNTNTFTGTSTSAGDLRSYSPERERQLNATGESNLMVDDWGNPMRSRPGSAMPKSTLTQSSNDVGRNTQSLAQSAILGQGTDDDGILNELDCIPALLDGTLDPLLVAAACPNEKEKRLMSKKILTNLRPRSANAPSRTRSDVILNSYHEHDEALDKPRTRPKTAGGNRKSPPPSPSKRPIENPRDQRPKSSATARPLSGFASLIDPRFSHEPSTSSTDHHSKSVKAARNSPRPEPKQPYKYTNHDYQNNHLQAPAVSEKKRQPVKLPHPLYMTRPTSAGGLHQSRSKNDINVAMEEKLLFSPVSNPARISRPKSAGGLHGTARIPTSTSYCDIDDPALNTREVKTTNMKFNARVFYDK